ncbi:hypothetical protein PTKIN_Ptkin10aG0184300 [Pterospermum kingtungense]
MGVCASSQSTTKGGSLLIWPLPTAKVIYPDGRLQEFRQPIKASLVLSQNPNCFLCNSEVMYVNSPLPHVPEDEQLQQGQIYFLMPLSKSHAPLSLQELCSLAIKASTVLSHLDMVHSSQAVFDFSDRKGSGFINIVGISSPGKSGNRKTVF